jgi:hypothetical protein
MKYIAFILKVIIFPFFRIPRILFTLRVKSIGILIFDCLIVAVIGTVMGLLNFYEGIVMIGLYFIIALGLGFAWRGLVSLYRKKFAAKLHTAKNSLVQSYTIDLDEVYLKKLKNRPQKVAEQSQQVIEKEIRKPTNTNKKSVKSSHGLPDFDSMSGDELGKWFIEHKNEVNSPSSKIKTE